MINVLLVVFSVMVTELTEELPALTPIPQEMNWATGGPCWLAATDVTGIATDTNTDAIAAALNRLHESTGKTLPFAAKGNVQLLLEPLPTRLPQRTRKEAYRLTIRPTGIVLEAETLHGIHNGLTSLRALYHPEKGFPCVSILDWPDQMIRGTYVAGIAKAENLFEKFVALKLNLVLIEDGALFDLDNQKTCDRYQNFVEKCRANFIEFVPELQSLGWGQFVLQREPRAVEARWLKHRQFPVQNGRVYSPDPPMPAPAVIRNASFEEGLAGWKAEVHHGHWAPALHENAAIVSSDKNTSNHILRLTLKKKGTVRVAQDVDVQIQARYEVACRIKTETVIGDSGAYLEVYGIGKQGAMALIGKRNRSIQGTHDWQSTRVTFDTGDNQRARPGGTVKESDTFRPNHGYEKIRIFVRLQDAVGTAYYDEVKITPLQSPNPLSNVVVTDKAKVIVENAAGTTVYEEGKDYTLEVPALQYPYTFSEPLDVVLTAESRINEGDVLSLSYNQATYEDITCCPSEPLYVDFMHNAIASVVKTLNPNYLHIGHDEPRFFNRDQRCKNRGLSNSALFAETIKNVYASAKEAKPEIRVMLWDDAINPYQNGPHLDTSDVASLLPKDMIINIWWYDNADWENQIDKSMAYFMNLGLEVTGSPWFRIPNAQHWAQVLNTYKNNPKSLGVIYTSWGQVPHPWAALEFTAEHAWSFGKSASPVL